MELKKKGVGQKSMTSELEKQSLNETLMTIFEISFIEIYVNIIIEDLTLILLKKRGTSNSYLKCTSQTHTHIYIYDSLPSFIKNNSHLTPIWAILKQYL